MSQFCFKNWLFLQFAGQAKWKFQNNWSEEAGGEQRGFWIELVGEIGAGDAVFGFCYGIADEAVVPGVDDLDFQLVIAGFR